MTQAAAKKQSQDLLSALESLSLTPAGTKSKDADKDVAKVTWPLTPSCARAISGKM